MENNNGKTIWMVVLGIVILVGIIYAISYFGKPKDSGEVKSAVTTQSEPSISGEVNTSLFSDENASVMFFYSDLCGWCNKEKLVLADLAKDGYRVKPMDVKAHVDYWQTFQISGTPTFIAKNGQKHTGYMEKADLKKFLDENK